MVVLRDFIKIAPDLIEPWCCCVYLEYEDEDWGTDQKLLLNCFDKTSELDSYLDYEVVSFDQDFSYGELVGQTIKIRGNINSEWFGIVRWCEDDLKCALEDKGYPATENNIAKLHSICSPHFFTDVMIERGWEFMHDSIGNDDSWDK